MNTQKEMYAANVKNWLMRIAEGAKAAQNSIQFAPAEPNELWRVTSSCYETFKDGVAIHHLEELANAIDVPVVFDEFDEDSYYHGMFDGYYYIELFGVRFYDLGNRVSEDEGK